MRIEFLGSEWLAYGRIDGAFENARVLCKLRQETVGSVTVGQTQDFVVPGARLRFFDKSTGVRIALAAAVPDAAESDVARAEGQRRRK